MPARAPCFQVSLVDFEHSFDLDGKVERQARTPDDKAGMAPAFAKDGTKPTVPDTGYIDTGVQLITDKPLGDLDSQDTAWGLDNCWGDKP